jgi:GTP pyrophosphokinase
LTHRARVKARQWFTNLALEQSMADGRAIVTRELQRMGETGLKLDELASRLGFARSDDLFVAAARAELTSRQIRMAARGTSEQVEEKKPTTEKKRRNGDDGENGVLIVGIDKLLSQLAGCCKPAPPDPIVGFVTRGKGVSIHRTDCPNFANMEAMQPERVIETAWGEESESVFAVDIVIDAVDRQGLLRDVSEILTKERINVIDVNTRSRHGAAHMRFTGEVKNLSQLKRALTALCGVKGVTGARRA